jgi:hypothetical protein
MNDFSLSLLVFAGLLLGIIFKDLLKEYGAGEKLINSYISFLILPFIVFIGYVFYVFFYYFQLTASSLSLAGSFASSELLYLAAATLVGGAGRFAVDALKGKKRSKAEHKEDPKEEAKQ